METLRAANARTLIEQSIGRGLRLPYGKRTGVQSVDRLNIIAHDRFQEIIDEANRLDIRISQDDIAGRVAAMEKRAGGAEAFAKLLAAVGDQAAAVKRV